VSALVVALGGNALMRPGERGTAAEQLANLRRAVAALRPLLELPGLVLTHGNGPQVGNELIRQERAADEAPPLPLWVAVAQTQAEIGTLIAAELRAHATPACLLTHVRVAADDPAFDRPTIVELHVIRRVAEGGVVAIACGGGGIPVVRRGERLTGVDAVIDKDRASALLASGLDAERLIILNEVPAVYRNFGEPDQREIRTLSRDEAGELLPELAEGSMRPKVEAALAFGGETVITNFEGLGSGGGTRIA
jgi:carbamate kinase